MMQASEMSSSMGTSPTQSFLNFFRRRRSSVSSQKSNSSLKKRDREMLAKTPCSFCVGVSEDRNKRYRKSMEDTHTYIYNYNDKTDCGYFGVYDGHAGPQVADWCSRKLHTVVASWLKRSDTQLGRLSPPPEVEEHRDVLKNQSMSTSSSTSSFEYSVPKALSNAFHEADGIIRKQSLDPSGSTVVVGVIQWEPVTGGQGHRGGTGSGGSAVSLSSSNGSSSGTCGANAGRKRMLYMANAGDARAVLCRGGKSLRLTYDHKASDPHEIRRIKNCGGVVMGSRVNGVLAVTRSLGDSYMKDLITGAPYTTSTELDADDEFLIIACDGLWDVCSDKKACNLIRDVRDPKEASQVLVQYALSNFSTDNLTVMVIRFDQSVFTTENRPKLPTYAPESLSMSRPGTPPAVEDNENKMEVAPLASPPSPASEQSPRDMSPPL